MSTTITALRHGQSTWNKEGRWQGQAVAPPLTELGEQQALEAAKRLMNEPRIDAMVTSRLTRARQTGAIIAEHLNIKQVDIIDDLQERDIGKYQGLLKEEINKLHQGLGVDEIQQDERAISMGFERNNDVANRIQSSFREVARRYPGKRVLVVTHGGCLMQFCRVLGLGESKFLNLSGRQFEVNNETNEILGGELIFAPSIEGEDNSAAQQSGKNGKESIVL